MLSALNAKPEAAKDRQHIVRGAPLTHQCSIRIPLWHLQLIGIAAVKPERSPLAHVAQ
jgi:hypothetical protein